MRCSQRTWPKEGNEAWGCHPPQVCAYRFSNRAPHSAGACAGHCRSRFRKYDLAIVGVVGCEQGWGGGMVFHKACAWGSCASFPCVCVPISPTFTQVPEGGQRRVPVVCMKNWKARSVVLKQP
jgi:hypothetical protein